MATDSFLQRWSAKKRGELIDDAEETCEDDTQSGSECLSSEPSFSDATEHGESREGEDADTLPPPATMDDVENLQEGDSAAVFLAKGVSSEVKKAALRKLFRSDAYNVLDGMNDYDLDYSNTTNLAAEVAANLRQWTKENVEEMTELNDQASSITEEESAYSPDPNARPHANAEETGNEGEEESGTEPDLTLASETKSTLDKNRDNLSYGVRQNVPTESMDNNSDGF
ncbi:DUF3306 domain-containing protein [Enterovibrio norvegicus]|uniref:DUF3306 domain-containing protein n=1 Tax=Enterovibrio norvegicus TaxID=188144 RepID=A0A2N7L5C5_9GAMM|nr:DUF3306 domain-containing protein [Enterovibrio norvegicus]PMN88813.1 hypothetical protein BCT23_04750 [Enterovibrio norvegicus]